MKKDVLFKKRGMVVCFYYSRGDKREAWLLIFMLATQEIKGWLVHIKKKYFKILKIN